MFAETEIIGLLASGERPENIVAGVQASLATRVAAMAGHAMTPPLVFTGGVALVPGMDAALAAALGKPVQIARHPQMTGALGAVECSPRGIWQRGEPRRRKRGRARGRCWSVVDRSLTRVQVVHCGPSCCRPIMPSAVLCPFTGISAEGGIRPVL